MINSTLENLDKLVKNTKRYKPIHNALDENNYDDNIKDTFYESVNKTALISKSYIENENICIREYKIMGVKEN